MTPGTYLRMRREAAGLSIDDVALILFGARPVSDRHAAIFAATLVGAEKDCGSFTEVLVGKLHAAFRFDPYIYGQLVAGLPAPTLCRRCACSWMDACDDEAIGPCSWSDADPELCTHCESKGRLSEAEAGHAP